MQATRADSIRQQLEINTLNATVGRQAAEITRQQAEIEQLKDENASLKAADEVRERQLQQMRATDNTRGIEMNRMKERSSKLQKLAKNLKERHDFMKEWYDSRNTTIVDGVKKITESSEIVRKRVNILWNDRCKKQEMLKKKDDDPEDQGNPDPSATSEQPPTSLHRLNLRKEPPVEKLKKYNNFKAVPSSKARCLAVHPITGEILEEGTIVSDMSHEQLLAL
ncbi:hypothetical protein Hanom_Chr16g01432741 [Helianthus anomalus]